MGKKKKGLPVRKGTQKKKRTPKSKVATRQLSQSEQLQQLHPSGIQGQSYSTQEQGNDQEHHTVHPPTAQNPYPSPNHSPTGIVEFDSVLKGGFPKGTVVLLAGSSGSGKTIFSFQWLFEGAKHNENGIYVSMTEPLFKSVKHLESMRFYDRNALEQERLKFLDIRDIAGKKGLQADKVISYIEQQVKETNAKRLVIDSITAIAYNLDDKALIRRFIFELGKVLATLGCTTILTSEVTEKGKFSVYGVEEFISDAILRFDQVQINNERQRVMQIIKVRGIGYEAEDLFFKISTNGIIVFPKFLIPLKYPSTTTRLSTGNGMLDEMLLGGLLQGSSTLIAGSTGTGKSLLSMRFIIEGLEKGETCLYAGFEESRDQLVRNAQTFGWNIEEFEKKGLLVIRSTYPSEKFLEEHFADIKTIVEKNKIQRCVIDSVSAIGNSFQKDSFSRFFKRLNGYLKIQSVTSLFLAATGTLIGTTMVTDNNLSSLTDNIIMLRYVEIQGELRQVINIVKTRGSGHSKGLRMYSITDQGIVIGQSLSGYEGVMTGVTRKVSETVDEKLEAEFKRFIGPIASSVFNEVKKKGLTKKNVLEFIDKLTEQGIMQTGDAAIFKENVDHIMTGTPITESNANPTIEDAFGAETTDENKKEQGMFQKLFKNS